MAADEIDIDAGDPDGDDVPEDDLADIEDDLDVDADVDVVDVDDVVEGEGEAAATVVTDAAAADDEDEGLEELEAEELEMLTDDEASESIAVDEVAELRALRREAREMDIDPEQAGAGEFVCQSCFLVKRINQLADKKKRYCLDCVA